MQQPGPGPVPRRPRFPLGQVVATSNALSRLSHDDVHRALARHAVGDWGNLCPEDRVANERALSEGARLFSSYQSSCGIKFWIITEWDRSATTVLLPEDY